MVDGHLKKKVVDRQRKDFKTSTADFDPIVDKVLDDKGRWTATAQAPAPLQLDLFEQSEFMDILKQCLEGLPPKQAVVFIGREITHTSQKF